MLGSARDAAGAGPNAASAVSRRRGPASRSQRSAREGGRGMSSGGSLLSTSLTTGDSANPRIVGGHGVWFRLLDGREVIDASNTAAPLGHGHPEIAEAIRSAADAPVINEGWHWADREQAAEDLLAIAFDGEDWAGAV